MHILIIKYLSKLEYIIIYLIKLDISDYNSGNLLRV